MEDKQLISFSLETLNYLSNKALQEISDSRNYKEETKILARRVLNSRMFKQ